MPNRASAAGALCHSLRPAGESRPASQLLINLSKLAKRFADYLELPLNSRLQ